VNRYPGTAAYTLPIPWRQLAGGCLALAASTVLVLCLLAGLTYTYPDLAVLLVMIPVVMAVGSRG